MKWQYESLLYHITPSEDTGSHPAESSATIPASRRQNALRQEATFDPRNFPDGIEVWYDCEDAICDICFVHGLSGSRDSTWTHKSSQRQHRGQRSSFHKRILSSGLAF